MARTKATAFPMPQASGGGVRKFVALVVVVVFVVLVIKNPTGTAGMVTALGSGLAHVVDALLTFAQALSG